MSKYLIKLTPLGKYYFGGDMTFTVGTNEDDKHNIEFSSYIIESNKFPQQTSLLGMMRYLLLKKSSEVFSVEENMIISNGAKELIGEKSFSVNANHEENQFGKIKSLYPCFLMKNNETYLPLPKDYELEPNFEGVKGMYVYNKRILNVPIIKNYDPKEFREPGYINTKTGEIVLEKNIFHKDTRIGIEKNHEGKSNEKGFYKQISYRLEEGFCFSFIIDVDFDLSKCKHEIVSLGGDSSMFRLECRDYGNKDVTLPDYEKISVDKALNKIKVVLLSESFITINDLENTCFQIAGTVPLRFIESNINAKNYNILSKEVNRGKKYQMYEKGSVFYFNDKSKADGFINKIMNKKEFRQIGYNFSVKHKNK